MDGALGVFADAAAAGDGRMGRVYFDVSVARWESKAESLAKRLRTIGMRRLPYPSENIPLDAWQAFRRLPLTAGELRQIERNVAPYLR